MNLNFKEYYIKLPNSIYDDLDIANDELTILILLYRNYQQYKNISLCNIQILLDIMNINYHNNKKIFNDIKDIIANLMKKEYVTSIYDLSGNGINENIIIDNIIKSKDTSFYIELPSPPEDGYFKIYDLEMNKIFEYLQSTNVSKYDFVRYFVACMRVCNTDNKFGYLPQIKIKSLVSDSRTIKRYNRILQDDLHLIRFNNDYLTPQHHYCATFIGLYDDEKGFNEQLKNVVKVQGLIHTDKIVSNKKRSIKQKINNNEKIKGLEEENKKLKEKLNELQYKQEKEFYKDED